MKILVFGGTKYLGLEYLKTLSEIEGNEVLVASRKEVVGFEVALFDRKNMESVKSVLNFKPDILIDFIDFSGPDALKLNWALEEMKWQCKVIHISTTYVYSEPKNIEKNTHFKESDFPNQNFCPNLNDWPKVGYVDGKRSAEYVLLNGSIKDLCILRFPIIVDANDVTNRTQFFHNLEKDDLVFDPKQYGGKINLVSKQSAAKVLRYLTFNFARGIFNVANYGVLDEAKIAGILHSKPSVNFRKYKDKSPFYSLKDMTVSIEKFEELGLPLDTVEEALVKIDNELRNSL